MYQTDYTQMRYRIKKERTQTMNETSKLVKCGLGLLLTIIIVVGGIFGLDIDVEMKENTEITEPQEETTAPDTTEAPISTTVVPDEVVPAPSVTEAPSQTEKEPEIVPPVVEDEKPIDKEDETVIPPSDNTETKEPTDYATESGDEEVQTPTVDESEGEDVAQTTDKND